MSRGDCGTLSLRALLLRDSRHWKLILASYMPWCKRVIRHSEWVLIVWQVMEKRAEINTESTGQRKCAKTSDRQQIASMRLSPWGLHLRSTLSSGCTEFSIRESLRPKYYSPSAKINLRMSWCLRGRRSVCFIRLRSSWLWSLSAGTTFSALFNVGFECQK